GTPADRRSAADDPWSYNCCDIRERTCEEKGRVKATIKPAVRLHDTAGFFFHSRFSFPVRILLWCRIYSLDQLRAGYASFPYSQHLDIKPPHIAEVIQIGELHPLFHPQISQRGFFHWNLLPGIRRPFRRIGFLKHPLSHIELI